MFTNEAPIFRDDQRRNPFHGRRVHFIGIGGCGMQGAAAILCRLGTTVSGSDVNPPEDADALTAGGVAIHVGHDAANVTRDVASVVYSAAIPKDNPELVRARQLSIPYISYARLLGMLMSTRSGVALAGTHGKSTTTGMTAYIFREAGLDPSFIVGADSPQLGGRSGAGEGEHFVVEACEYNRSFLHFRPSSAAVLNLEVDHLDYYDGLDDLVEAFNSFCSNVPPDGLIVIPNGDEAARRAAAGVEAEVETFGFSPGATWRACHLNAEQGCYEFDVLRDERPVLHAKLGLAGAHNVSNALAAIALAFRAGAAPDDIARAVASYEGVRRRMTLRGGGRGVIVVDDYAHHPTEIRATIRAVRDRYNPKRTWVVFQPHQYSRTRRLMNTFAESFGDADMVLVPEIFAARDSAEDREAIGAADLVARIHSCGRQAKHIPGLCDVTDHLERNVGPGDLVLTMGAGDVWKVADGLVERIRQPG
ncbi:MAG: UDP-N-acetylmuramate--L-alanine ligase [Phycisphaerales bacterium]|nr:MAG: UDP-N-acetylmuramate--L-alanine ligase [Phycisphaerales bacterium]